MKPIKKFWASFDKTNTVLAAFAGVLLILLMLSISIDVSLRYFFGITFTGLLELSEFSLLWITFLATAWLLTKTGHVNIDFVINRLSPRPKVIFNIGIYLVSAIIFSIITWYGVKVTWQDFQLNTVMATILEPLKWPIEAIIPIGSFLLFIGLLRKTYEYILSWKTMRSDK